MKYPEHKALVIHIITIKGNGFAYLNIEGWMTDLWPAQPHLEWDINDGK